MSMVASHLIWLFRTRELRKRAKEANMTFDEFPEAVQWQSQGIDLEARIIKTFSRKTKTEKQDGEGNQEAVVETETIGVTKENMVSIA